MHCLSACQHIVILVCMAPAKDVLSLVNELSFPTLKPQKAYLSYDAGHL